MTYSQITRILKIYNMLEKGEKINKLKLATYFNVDERTIRRDINSIKKYLDIEYDGRYILKDKGNEYRLETLEEENFHKIILLISKILLDSRAFNKKEKDIILNSLMNKTNKENRGIISKFIRNENYNYVELEHRRDLINRIWEITSYIHKQEIIKVKYKKINGDIVNREINPLGIVFSEFYFYLVGKYKKGERTIVIRVDRIFEIEGLNKRYRVNYLERFQEGEFKKRVQFMYSGDINRIRFIFKDGSIEDLKDRLPTARVNNLDGNSYLVDAEVMGEGIIMWLLSQGKRITLLEPREFVDKIKSEIRGMERNYL